MIPNVQPLSVPSPALSRQPALRCACTTPRLIASCHVPPLPPGLQSEMLNLKEGTDNRMLVLESLMREIGGDKMKGAPRPSVAQGLPQEVPQNRSA